MAERVTQAPVEVLVQPDDTDLRVTSAAVEALVAPDLSAVRVRATQLAVEVLISAGGAPGATPYAWAQVIG